MSFLWPSREKKMTLGYKTIYAILKEREGEAYYRWKGHNGSGTFLEARFRVSASCQYWQVLKTFKEVKTLFSVYKSSVL